MKLQKPDCKSLLEQLREDLPGTEIAYAYGYAVAGNDFSHIDEALEICQGADVILMTLGGKHGSCSVASMGEGVDGTNINLPECQDEFIRRAAGLGIPMVGIHFDGRPISSDTADQYLDAIVEAWNPAEMGAPALSMILRGQYNPSGKMPVTVARHAGQLPIFYNHYAGSSWHQGESIGFRDYVDLPHEPRYYFGHGLSYTDFSYSNLRVNQEEVSAEDELKVSFDIENTGEMEGTEIAQFYFADCYASVSRPVKELAGFGRISLKPGEKKTMQFVMKTSQFAFLDRNMQWKVEQGDINLEIGTSSEDIRLKGHVRVVEDAIVNQRTRGFFAECLIL